MKSKLFGLSLFILLSFFSASTAYAVDRSCEQVKVWQYQEQGGPACYGGQGSGGCLYEGAVNNNEAELRMQVLGLKEDGEPYTGNIDLKVTGTGIPRDISNQSVDGSGNSQSFEYGSLPVGSYRMVVQKAGIIDSNFCTYNFNVLDKDECEVCQEEAISGLEKTPFLLCDQLPEGSVEKQSCVSCASGGGNAQDPGGVWTAIGCISKEPSDILNTLLTTGLTVGGGVALLMIMGAGFIFSTSAGDPKRVDQAKELMTAAVTGLIFIIFSVTILQFIGVSVLKIPGFGG